MKRSRAEYDLAYWSFLFCGVTSLVISSLEASHPDSGTAGILGFFVAIPLALGSLVAVCIGIVICARLRGHWPLIVLSSISVLLIVVVGGAEALPSPVVSVVPIAYGAIVVATCGWWFLVRRRRHSTSGS